MPPKEYRSITKEALLRKYLDNTWPEILAHLRHDEWCCGNRKVGHKWTADDGSVVCRLFEYRDGGGKVISTVVRQLREGDVFWDVDLAEDIIDSAAIVKGDDSTSP